MNAVELVARLTTEPALDERGGTHVGRLRQRYSASAARTVRTAARPSST